MSSLRTLVAATTLLIASTQTLAVDGVLLIDQNKSLAGNITPGDTPGFPVSINQPGSYRLSSNLTVPANTDAIHINSDDVTLDLNGFTITGAGVAKGIFDQLVLRQRISIGNGSFVGFGLLGPIRLLSSEFVTVERIRDNSVGGISIATGKNALIQRNVVSGLIQIGCPAVITENITQGFITVIISATDNCVRWNNRSITFNGAVNQ